ncbi:choice-of-anchor D domain-containing protein [Myxococcota bacterium]|nr:choice-of-anchor D domain-containing protein [Myxococcota bacterium]
MSGGAATTGLLALAMATACDGGAGLSWTGASVTPSALEFGDVGVGRLALRTVAVDNPTTLPLALGRVHVEPADAPFIVDARATTVAAGARVLLDVRFAPTREGSTTARLDVPLDGARTFDVALTGRGVERDLRLDARDACGPVPSTVDFGVARPGDRVERSVPVVVTGDGLATIVRSTLTGPFELTTPLPAVARDGAPLPLSRPTPPAPSSDASSSRPTTASCSPRGSAATPPERSSASRPPSSTSATSRPTSSFDT